MPIHQEVGNKLGEANSLSNIGLVYSGLGQLQKGLEYYQQALAINREIGDRSGEATTLNNIGLVYDSIEQPQKALDYYNQALSILQKIGDKAGESAIFSKINDIPRTSYPYSQEIESLEESIELILEVRSRLRRESREAFLRVINPTTITLIDLLIRQNQYQKAFQWANLVTTFELADYTRLIDAKVAKPNAQKVLNRLNEKNRQVADLQRKNLPHIQLEEETIKQTEEAIKQYPEIAELLETNPADIAQLQQNIPENTVVIQPILLTGIENVPNTVAIFVLTQDKLTVIQ